MPHRAAFRVSRTDPAHGGRGLRVRAFVTALIAAVISACSPLYEKPKQDRVIDRYLATLPDKDDDPRVPALAVYGRALDHMLTASTPVEDDAGDVFLAQTCFLQAYGIRAEEWSQDLTRNVVAGHEARWRQYVEISSSMPEPRGDDPCLRT